VVKRSVALGLALLAFAALGARARSGIPSPQEAKAAIGHLGPVPVPAGNPLTRATVDLGAWLFRDPMLSGDGSVSCETCHLPDHGYATPDQLGPAYPSKAERRNSPSLINVAYNLPLIWDGRAGMLDKQPLGSIGNVLHMNNNRDLLVEQLKADPTYLAAFRAAFGDEAVTTARIGRAIGAFERTLVFDDSPLDRYMAGDESALDGAQKRGLDLFLRGAGCIVCHNGPNLTDNQFHNLGVPDDDVTGDPAVMASVRFDAKRNGYQGWEQLGEDPGRALITKDPADLGAFRTMGLRNIAESAPYMHNGAFETLEQVIAFYDRGGGNHPNKSSLLKPLGLSDADKADLAVFLRTALTGKQRPGPVR